MRESKEIYKFLFESSTCSDCQYFSSFYGTLRAITLSSPVTVAVRVCVRLFAEIVVSNPAGGMDACFL